MLPVVVPLQMSKHEVSGFVVGLLLASPLMATAVTIPFLSLFIVWVGLEKAIMISNIGGSISCTLLGIGLCLEDRAAFLAMTTVFSITFGICFSLSVTAENVLLLRYSPKEDRERNIGYFRAASGIGSAFSPVLVSICLLFSDYWLCFLFVAVCLSIATPFIYSNLVYARDTFNKEASRE